MFFLLCTFSIVLSNCSEKEKEIIFDYQKILKIDSDDVIFESIKEWNLKLIDSTEEIKTYSNADKTINLINSKWSVTIDFRNQNIVNYKEVGSRLRGSFEETNLKDEINPKEINLDSIYSINQYIVNSKNLVLIHGEAKEDNIFIITRDKY